MFLYVAAFFVSLFVARASMPKIQNAKPSGLNELQVNTAEEGREIPVVFGTVDIKSANCVWYGDFSTRDIRKKTGKSTFGKSKYSTVGHKYHAGFHLVLCHGPIDNIVAIKVENKTLWQGSVSDGTLLINAGSIFGGDDKEGGIYGNIDVLNGSSSQGVNSYLATHTHNPPAYRGVVSAVLKSMYIGTQARMKQWVFRTRRIYTREDGIAQWYPERASVLPPESFNNSSLYIALDVSGSMVGGRLSVLKAGMRNVLNSLQGLVAQGNNLSIKLQAYNDSFSEVTRFNASVGDFEDLREFIDGLSASGGTNAVNAFSGVSGFFNPAVPRNNVCVCISDGEMDNVDDALGIVGNMLNLAQPPFSYDEGTAVSMRGIGIQTAGSLEYFDNGVVPVPVITGLNINEMRNTIMAALLGSGNTGDMNPSHIIRECLTNKDWGMGYNESDINDDYFVSAADIFFAEGMGLSFLWDKQKEIEDFIKEVLKHIDAVLRVGMENGQFELVPVRLDYDVATLPLFDENNIEKINEFKRTGFGELCNSVTVKYYDNELENDSAVTIQDIALCQQQQSVISTTVTYPAFTNKFNATRAAQRDLKTLSSPLISGKIAIADGGRVLKNGSVFKFSWASFQVQEVIVRVTGISYGDGRSNVVEVEFVEDAFSFPQQIIVTPPKPEWQPPVTTPLPLQNELAIEMPYFMLIENSGKAAIDSELNLNSNLGFIGIAAARRQGMALSAKFLVNSGNGFVDNGDIAFCPHARLSADFGVASEIGSGIETQAVLKMFSDTEDGYGKVCQINDEILAIETIEDDLFTFKRGCFDTVPQRHSADSIVYFWEDFLESDGEEYTANNIVQSKLLPVTSNGELPFEQANMLTVSFNSRAIRPYPPGNVKINGFYFPAQAFSTVNLTWSNRNRLIQSLQDIVGFESDSDSIETDTTVSIEVYSEFGELAFSDSNIAATSYAIPASALTAISPQGYVLLYSVKNGIRSLFSQKVDISVITEFGDNLLFEMNKFGNEVQGDSLNFKMDSNYE